MDKPLIATDQSGPCYKWLIRYCVATALFSALGIIAAGVVMFFVGLTIFIWNGQPLVVSVIATIPIAVLVPLISIVFIPHVDGRMSIIKMLAQKKGNW